MSKKFKYILSVFATIALTFGIVNGATILQTASTDTLGTFRTNTNTSLLNLNNALFAGSFGVITASSTLTVDGLSTLTGFISTASSTAVAAFNVNGLTTLKNGLVSTASSTFVSTLGINGLLTSNAGFISGASSTIVGNLSLSGVLRASSTATSTLQGGLNIVTGCLSVGGSCLTSGAQLGDANTWSALQTFSSGLLSTASSSFSSTLDLTGLLTAKAGLISSASSTVASTLDVAGLLTSKNGLISSASSTISSTLDVGGLITAKNGFISSASSTIAGNLSISGVLRASSTATSTLQNGINVATG